MQDESQMTSQPPPTELLVTVEEAARRLALSRTTLYQQIRRGVIPSVRIGHSRRIPVIDLERYIDDLRDDSHSDARRRSR
jgi:excisionase family DNA binding protein